MPLALTSLTTDTAPPVDNACHVVRPMGPSGNESPAVGVPGVAPPLLLLTVFPKPRL